MLLRPFLGEVPVGIVGKAQDANDRGAVLDERETDRVHIGLVAGNESKGGEREVSSAGFLKSFSSILCD